MLAAAHEPWTIDKLMALPLDQMQELWKTLPAPDFNELDGEYDGHAPDGGDEDVRRRKAEMMYDETSRQGYWLRKAFHPTSAAQGQGHNVWRKARGIIRRMRYGTYAGASLIDGKPAFLVRYGDFKTPAGDIDLVDEIRKLDDGLYIGAATSRNADGTRSEPDLFLLSGPVGPWIGVDNEQSELKET